MVTDAEADGGVPYIMAFTLEVLRYFTALRLALPRSNQSDVRYNQILIPRGSTIFPNALACNMETRLMNRTPSVQKGFSRNPTSPYLLTGLVEECASDTSSETGNCIFYSCA